jgi:hypothetical protein
MHQFAALEVRIDPGDVLEPLLDQQAHCGDAGWASSDDTND